MDYSSSPAPTTPSQPPQMPPQFEHSMIASGIPVNTNVVMEQTNTRPSPHATTINVHANSPVPWSTGLCGCFEDINSCCLTCWCPCITFGRIAEVVDRGTTSCGVSGALYNVIMCVTGCACLYSCFYRTKLRGQYFLEDSPCSDCCIHCCCEECALCQEYRELKNQGFDMSIGWHGNVERQKRVAAMVAPAVQGGMTRSL